MILNRFINIVLDTVICLMALLTISSVVWNLSIDFMPTQLHSAFVGVKIRFRERDFTKMSTEQIEMHKREWTALNARKYNGTQLNFLKDIENHDDLKPEKYIMTTDEKTGNKQEKVPKVGHVIQTNKNPTPAIEPADKNELLVENTTQFNLIHDIEFLYKKTFFMEAVNWHIFMIFEWVPYISEIVSIFWIFMFLLFQSNLRHYNFLPKPWRIVLPTIVVFTMMFVLCVIYTIMTILYMNVFCNQLRSKLIHPNAISCGEAFDVLQPTIKHKKYGTDLWINLFEISVLTSLVLWGLVLIVMVFRYLRAIDFEHVHSSEFDYGNIRLNTLGANEYVEVPLHVPSSILPVNNLQDNAENRCSLDDFQSAKSHTSGVVTPLL